jgi:hypothetical protein
MGESININTCRAYSHRRSGEGGEDWIQMLTFSAMSQSFKDPSPDAVTIQTILRFIAKNFGISSTTDENLT